jgi:hypothetical protein
VLTLTDHAQDVVRALTPQAPESAGLRIAPANQGFELSLVTEPVPGGDDDQTQARHVASRAELLPKERAAGSDDPQAKVILEESEEHTEHPDLDASSPSRRESPRED